MGWPNAGNIFNTICRCLCAPDPLRTTSGPSAHALMQQCCVNLVKRVQHHATLQKTRFRNRIVYMNIIFCPMPLRTSSIVKHNCGTAVAVFLSKTFSGRGNSIVKHDCGTAVAAFLSRTFGGPGILQFSLLFTGC